MDVVSPAKKPGALSAYVLFSSSKGNSVFLSDGETSVLIDAGKTPSAIAAALGEIGHGLEEIDAVFVTHEHRDHTSALPALCKKHPFPVYLREECAEELSRLHAAPEDARPFSGGICIDVGRLHIESFPTPHDSRASVGYTVRCGDLRLGLATDMGHMSRAVFEALSGCDAVIIESNYDAEMLKNGKYPPYLQRRIRSATGHLSNDECAEVLPLLYKGGVRRFMLAHLSEENNRPEIALRTSSEALSRAGITADVLAAAPAAVRKLL